MRIWPAIVLSGLAVLVTSLASSQTLDRPRVLSLRGEPLKAQVAVRNAPTTTGLQMRMLSPDNYRALGLKYDPALATAQISATNPAPGEYLVQLTTTVPVTTELIDLAFEVRGTSNNIVRNDSVVVPQNRAALDLPFTQADFTNPAAAASAKVGVDASKQSLPTASAGKGATRIKVEPGQTAGGIALPYSKSGVSLNQMLAALLTTNPNAFIDSNVNRLKAGVNLDIPATETVSKMDLKLATDRVQQQLAEYRARAATMVAKKTDDASRSSPSPSGKGGKSARETAAERGRVLPTERVPGINRDRLSLASPDNKPSRGQNMTQQEEQAARAQQLQKNIDELKQIQKETQQLASNIEKSDSAATAAVISAGASTPSANSSNAQVGQPNDAQRVINAVAGNPDASNAPASSDFIDRLLRHSWLPYLVLLVLIALLAVFTYSYQRGRLGGGMGNIGGERGLFGLRGSADDTPESPNTDSARAPKFDFNSVSLDLNPSKKPRL